MNHAIIQGLLTPWIAGAVTMAQLEQRPRSKAWFIGAAWLLGQAMLAAVMYAQATLAGAIDVERTTFLLMAAAILLLARHYATFRRSAAETNPPDVAPRGEVDSLTRAAATCRCRNILLTVALAVMALLTLARFASMAAAAIDVPIRADDAYTIWLYKAKVITICGTLPLDPADPYYMGGSFAHYPPLMPLLAAWLPMCAGGWSEPLVAMTWIMFYASLMLTVGGAVASLNRSGKSTAGRRAIWPAIVAAYLAGSIPLAAVHAYRPGYADLPLACFLAAAVGAMLRWLRGRRISDFVVATIFAAATACTKREGVGVAAIAMTVLIVASAPAWRAATRRDRLIGAAALLIAAALTARVVDFGDQGRALAGISYHPEAWAALRRHALDWMSFGPAFVAVLGAVVLTLAGGVRPAVLAAVLSIALGGFVAGIFLLTDQVRFALNDQTPSRLLLQVLPAMMLAWFAAGTAAPRDTAAPVDMTAPGDMAAPSSMAARGAMAAASCGHADQ
jgi:hypothetical protein